MFRYLFFLVTLFPFLLTPCYSQGMKVRTEDPYTVTVKQSGTDAFGRLKVSNPATMFDSQLQYNLQPLIWESVTSGTTVTHLPDESSARIRVSPGSGNIGTRQTYRYMRYQPGKGQSVSMTGVVGAPKAGVESRMGLFDDNNGFFLEQTENGPRIVRRSNVTGSVVDKDDITQANWNKDRLDGTGDSGIVLDLSKTQIVEIKSQWLGVGRVQFGFNINGESIVAHEFLHANNETTAYTTTMNLPVRYEIEDVGSMATDTDLIQICSSVQSDGGFETLHGLTHEASMGTTTNGVTSREVLISVQPKTTFNSIENRVGIVPTSFEVYASGNDAFIELVYDGTLSGPTFNDVDTTNSAAEFDVVQSQTITGGTVIWSGYAIAGSGNSAVTMTEEVTNQLWLTLNKAGDTPTPLSLVATSMSGTSTLSATLRWAELQ